MDRSIQDNPYRPAALELRGWGYRHAYRNHFAVKDLSLSIPAGQRVLLLGASGIGKSTILEGVAGLLGDHAPQSGQDQVEDDEGGVTQGQVLIDGNPAVSSRGRVGLVLQDPDAQAIFQRLGDNVAFGPENMGLPREEIWPRVQRAMAEVGLADLQLTRSTMHLSGGQMQRLALAGALAMQPGLLLLDEPTANLDPVGVDQIVGAVRKVLDRQGSTMILVEHRAGPWMDMIDRVIVLGLGEVEDSTGGSGAATYRKTVIMADGSPQEVFTDPGLDLASLGIWVPEAYRSARDSLPELGGSRVRSGQSDPGRDDHPVLLAAQDLAVGRQGKAVAEHIDLEFRAGQITALVGANGAGKSTLAMTLAGLLEPVAGSVLAQDRLLRGLQGQMPAEPEPIRWTSSQLAARIAYVFQNPEHQFARGTVLDEVKLAPIRTGMSEDRAQARALELLDRFRLRQYAHANPYTLSGGEKRRLTVASALAAAPQMLILDEPTFGQDRNTWVSMAQLIADLRDQGACIILVTHDRELVQALDARLVEMTPPGAQKAVWPVSESDLQARQKTVAARLTVTPMDQRDEPVKPASRSQYIASINPAFRLIGAFLAALPLLISLDPVSATTALILEFLMLGAAGFTPLRVVRSTWPIFLGAPGSALAIILYGKSGGATFWQWGMIHITQRSLDLALATALRILAIGIPAIITVLGIDATDLADAFSQVLHLPDRFVYGGLAGMRLFTVLKDDWSALTASRRSRGLGDENRFKAFMPQAFALLVLSIRRSTTLATAMEARGFGGSTPRTHARVSQIRPRDAGFLLICLAVPAISLTLAALTGSIAFFGN
ncbi:ATP-binding cassette domain-containing protein [Bifidobacterium sp. H1HS16N]|uniref:ATP-binding cassette domain-containing protein n=2 Tax=Bifidobacterium kimbladii TaxID=1293826 RepID=A0ABU3KCW4_9BIFI|nr:ATP-binding cassette domain-containing protein [Bifidobacterium sp. H1HS16N]MDT7508576.1 ATP-binding cassette domain-containing protein [Bifidobacterium sp. H1HS16N]